MTDTQPPAPASPSPSPLAPAGGLLRVVIVGGGISGLSTARFLSEQARLTGTLAEITVLESSPRFGGILGTDREDGFLYEYAADQFLASPVALDLVRALGIEDQLISPKRVQPAIKVWARGALRSFPKGMPLAVPSELIPFLFSDLLSWKGKLRVLAEALMRADDGAPDDESMLSFFTRRLGKELADAVVGSVLAGIYSGDPDTLSIQATFPRFPAMVKAEGSLLLAALKQARSSQGKAAFRTFRDGMGTLIDALLASLRTRPEVLLRPNTQVQAVSRNKPTPAAPHAHQPQGQFRVMLSDGTPIEADAVVVALPTTKAAALLREDFGDVAWHLDGFESTTSGGVYLAYRRADTSEIPSNIGILMPRSSEWTVRGVSISTNKFEGRAPDDFHLLRVFIGGEGHTDIIDQDDAEIVRRVRADLSTLINLTATPTHVRVRRYRQQTPQYRVGHLKQVALLTKHLPPGLKLVGNAYSGVGVPACIKMAQDTAFQLIP